MCAARSVRAVQQAFGANSAAKVDAAPSDGAAPADEVTMVQDIEQQHEPQPETPRPMFEVTG